MTLKMSVPNVVTRVIAVQTPGNSEISYLRYRSDWRVYVCVCFQGERGEPGPVIRFGGANEGMLH